MGQEIIYGKALSETILSSLPARVERAGKKLGRSPSFAVVSAPGDYAARVYRKREYEACARLGITASSFDPGDLIKDARGFISILNRLGADPGIDAVMVERPLPENLNLLKVWEHLSPGKDVDGASVINMGKLFLCKSLADVLKGGFFVSCTALAVIKLLAFAGVNPGGKRAVVIGRSGSVGRPLAHLLSCQDATVTLCHSKTRDLAEIMKGAGIIVSAVGKARWLKADMISLGVVIIDVGTNRDENGKFCGDVDFENVKGKASLISPVPGGLGPVTLACLMENIVSAAEQSAGIPKG